jgi:chemotaxis protein histidine kinase CheA
VIIKKKKEKRKKKKEKRKKKKEKRKKKKEKRKKKKKKQKKKKKKKKHNNKKSSKKRVQKNFQELFFVSLKIKRSSEDDVSLDEVDGLCKLVFEFCVSDCFGSSTELSHQFFQTSETTNDTSLKHISHLTNLNELCTFRPGEDHIHHMGLELFHVLFHVESEFGFLTHLRDSTSTVLKLSKWIC